MNLKHVSTEEIIAEISMLKTIKYASKEEIDAEISMREKILEMRRLDEHTTIEQCENQKIIDDLPPFFPERLWDAAIAVQKEIDRRKLRGE